jgi:hypothetical protein
LIKQELKIAQHYKKGILPTEKSAYELKKKEKKAEKDAATKRLCTGI